MDEADLDAMRDLIAELREARAVIARVRALCDEWDAATFDPWYWTEVTTPLRHALDGTDA